MKTLTIFACFAISFVIVLAAPSPNHSHHQVAQKTCKLEIPTRIAPLDNGRIVVKPNDWLSDLIGKITGTDVPTLLIQISNTLAGLDDLVKQAEGELLRIIVSVGKEAQAQIQAVLNDALGEARIIIAPILEQLGLVIPAIQRRKPNNNNPDDVSDLIEIIIGKSLEELLTSIGRALIQLDCINLDTVARLEYIAQTTAQSAAVQIQAVVDNTLTEANAVITPVLDILEQLLPLSKFPVVTVT